MTKRNGIHGFTLIELLTVIAIIAVLAALLFPVVATAREQGRATDCMSKLHQLWVSATVYREDEGGYPPSLLGYAEIAPGAFPGGCDPTLTTGVPVTNPGAQCVANVDRIAFGYLFSEQVKDSGVFRCPDQVRTIKNQVTIAHFPPKPTNWPAAYAYVTDPSPDPDAPVNVCGSDGNGLIDCYIQGPLRGSPKYYYTFDSYDIGPRLTGPNSATNTIFDVHYSLDWTGHRGATDLPDQLKYTNPPSDKTMLAYCTWHTQSFGATTVPAIQMGGTAKKLDVREIAKQGNNIYNR